jgi:hypothetical protein
VLGWNRQALRRTVDLWDRVPCHLLDPQMCDGNRLEAPVLKLSEGSIRTLRGSRKFSFFSLWKGNFLPFSHGPPPAGIGNSIQEHSCRSGGWRDSPLLFSLSLFINQHRGDQHIHLCWEMLWCCSPKIIWLALYIAHLKLFATLYILPKPWGIFLITHKKSKFNLSKNSFN